MNDSPDDNGMHFHRDDGTIINPELIRKPSLCVTCAKDNNPEEEILCIITRADQEGESQFICDAYVPTKKI